MGLQNIKLLEQTQFDIVFVLAKFDVQLMDCLMKITPNIVQGITRNT